MTPAWVLILIACISLVGVATTAIVTNAVNARINKAVQKRWEADQQALTARWRADQEAAESRWHTELLALEGRTTRAEDADERQDKRAKALDIYKLASERVISENPRVAQLGADALKALLAGDLVDGDMKPLVVAALGSSYATERKAVEAAELVGEEILVVQVDLEVIETGSVALTEHEKAGTPLSQAQEGSDG